MIGAGKPDSRSLPGRPRPDRRRQLRRPDRRRARRRRRAARPLAASPSGSARRSPREALALHDDGLDPAGPATAPFDGEGVPRRRTALIEGGRAAHLPLRHLHGQRAAASSSTGNAGRAGYRSPPLGLGLEPGRRPRLRSASSSCSREAGEGVFVTDVAGLHSGVNPVTGVFSVGASGRAIRGGELAEPLREFTIASDLVSMLRRRPGRRSGAALGAVRRLGQHAAAADRRDDRRRVLSASQPAGALTPCPLLDCGPTFNPEEEFRRDKG